MAIEFTLADPVEAPVIVTATYRVVSIVTNSEAPQLVSPGGTATPSGYVSITLRDNNDVQINKTYSGQEALDMIAIMNTGNFTTVSLHARILNKIAADGSLTGTVTGMAEPPSDPAVL